MIVQFNIRCADVIRDHDQGMPDPPNDSSQNA